MLLKTKTKKHYHGSSTADEVGVSIDDFEHVCGEFVHVGYGSDTECHNTALAGKRSDVTVYANVNVLTDHLCTFSIWCVLLKQYNTDVGSMSNTLATAL